jgi:sugar phosphate isomerase/epimerase
MERIMYGMTRRQFLSRGATAAAAVAVGTALPYRAWGTPLGLPIGIQLYVVNADLGKDAPGTIKKLADIGYKEVESAGFGSAHSAAELKKILDDNGIKCPSAHLQFDLKNLNKAFDDGHALGCTYVTTSVPKQIMMSADMPDTSAMSPEERRAAMAKIMGGMLAPLTPDEFAKMAEMLNKVGAAAKQSGLKFAVHNHTMEFAMDNGKPGYDYLLSHTEKDLVTFEIDCGWITVAGYKPGEFINRYPGRIKMLHIKDFVSIEKGASTGPNSPKGAEIGTGVVNYKEIFASVKGKGIEHIFVEQEGPYSRMPAMEAAAVDYKYLASLT